VLPRPRRWVGDLTEGQTWYTANWCTRDLRELDGGSRAVLEGAEGGGSGAAGSVMLMAQSTATSHGEMRLLEHVEVIQMSSGNVQSAPSRSTKEPRPTFFFGAHFINSPISCRSASPVGTNTPASSHDFEPREHAFDGNCDCGDAQFCTSQVILLRL
jgi:hypothetical protein